MKRTRRKCAVLLKLAPEVVLSSIPVFGYHRRKSYSGPQLLVCDNDYVSRGGIFTFECEYSTTFVNTYKFLRGFWLTFEALGLSDHGIHITVRFRNVHFLHKVCYIYICMHSYFWSHLGNRFVPNCQSLSNY